MQNPPDLQAQDATLATNAAANTVTESTVLIAPPPGHRYRIWAISCVNKQDMAFVSVIDARFGPGTTPFVKGGTSPESPSWHMEIPGGYRGPEDTGFTVRTFATVANRQIQWAILYTIEQVTP